ncbi:MAG: response regulator [Rhodospirillales bacterium]|nr:response regulator [Rhodospirillales bacterium]MCB9995450.1 response regulator [Rhodospirillales bacterium]
MSEALPQRPSTMPHVLIVDDDERIRQLVSRYLRENGFIVAEAESAAEARDVLKLLSFDVMVVDIMMPGETGLVFTQGLRDRHNNIPVLLLTALGEAEDRIAGLETGADDYLTKPFEPRELVLRLQAILRRRPQEPEQGQVFTVGRWRYDPAHKELQDGNETVRLTTVEDNLLRALASRSGAAISREELARLCDLDAGERTIDVQVTRLRRKIEDDPKMPRCLQTVRGKGYMLRTGALS